MDITEHTDGNVQTITVEEDDTQVSWSRVGGDLLSGDELEDFVKNRNVSEKLEKKRNEQS